MHFIVLTLLATCAYVAAFPRDGGLVKRGCDQMTCENEVMIHTNLDI